MSHLVTRALAFATAAHAAIGQTRDYTDEPYVAHPIAVAEIVRSVAPHDPAMVAAALLHDVVEDTKITLDLVAEVFGDDVAELVRWVTKPKGGSADAVLQILVNAPARAQIIKVADIIDNASTIRLRDPRRAARYLPKKRAQVEVMVLADPVLRERALDACGRAP